MHPQQPGSRSNGGARTAGFLGATALVVHFVHLHVVISSRYVFEDQAVLWDVARDLRSGQIRPIDFPGQSYDSSLEAIPAAVLGGLGLGDARAFSTGMLLVALAAWLGLAAALARRSLSWLAAATTLLPVAMTVDNSAVALMWVTAAPRTLAVLAAAAALGVRGEQPRWALAVALGGLAMILDSSSALLVVSVLIWMIGERRGVPWRPVAIGLAVPVFVLLIRTLGHRANPAYDLHPPPDLRVGRKPLEWHIRNPTRAFAEYGPELFHSPWLRTAAVVAALGAIGLVALRRGNTASRAATAAAALGLLLFLSTNGSLRSVEFDTPLPSAGRGLMALPFVMVFLTATLSDSGRRSAHRATFAAVAGLALLGIVHRTATDAPGDFVREVTATTAVDLVDVGEIGERCERIAGAMRAAETTIALSWNSTTAWACSASLPDDSTVLFPPYERRTWELERALDISQHRWVVWQDGRVEIVETRPIAWRDAATVVGLDVRPLPPDWPR